MIFRMRSSFLYLSSLWVCFLSTVSYAQNSTPSTTPDESVLGTIDLTKAGTGENSIPLPKVAFVPLVTRNIVDSLSQIIVRHDFDLSGQFEILEDKTFPQGPFVVEQPLDVPLWRSKGHEMVVRIFANVGPMITLTGEVYAVKSNRDTPAASHKIEISPFDFRRGLHQLADALIGDITGRPGGFSSQMAFTRRIGVHNRQVTLVDSDGFNLRGYGPSNEFTISPTFGPHDEVFYALSRAWGPFKVVRGTQAIEIPLPFEGSVLGVAISSDRSKMAVTTMHETVSHTYVGDSSGQNMKAISMAPMASQPIFGPLGKVAFVAGSPVQRIHIDNKPISPAGFMASQPTFCETPKGLLVVYTVRVGSNEDIVASDTNGGGLFRLTQNQGSNTYPACSPDGRMLAFFSTRKTGKGPGLYITPLANPRRAQPIASVVGESLKWEAFRP